MKKYIAPELEVEDLNIQSLMAASYEEDNPIPVITPEEAAKENVFEDFFD